MKGKEEIRPYSLRLLNVRSRSISEINERLIERDYDPNDIVDTIEWLRGLNYLDDERFAREFIRSKLFGKLWGKRKISFELVRKGLAREIIETALSEVERDEELEVARKALHKWTKRKRLSELTEMKDRAAALKHLEGKGFGIDISRAALNRESDYEVI